MNTHVGHHYDSAADVERNVSGKAVRYGDHRPFATLDLHRYGAQAVYFLDSESIDVFIAKVQQLAADLRALEATVEGAA